MRIIDAKCNISLPLGRLGENEYTCIRFDVSKWLTEMPTAVIALYNQRPQDAEAYPVDGISVRDGIVTWTVTSAELTQVGNGRCELVAIENEVVAKSAFYDTVIFDALGGNGEAPEPWVSWQQTFAQMKADAEAAAQSAEEAVEHYPRITEGIWQVWDAQTGAWVSTGVHAQGDKGDDALCVYLENPTVNIPCDADGLTKPSNQVAPVCYTAFRGSARIAASSEFAGYTYANPKQMSPNEIYGFEINPATATQHGTIGFRFTEGVSPFGTLQSDMLTQNIGITVEGSEMSLPLQFVCVRDGEQGDTGAQGPKGDTYELTESDRQEIGHMYDDLLTQTEAAKDDAVIAKNNAVSAKEAAQTAQTAAETAQENAETAAGNAADYRDIAEGHAQDADDYSLASEGYAKGTQGGHDVSSGSPYYEDNAKYYKEATEEMVEGIAQENTAEQVLSAAQGTLAALQQLVNLQAMVRYYDELPDEGTEGYTYITPDGTYHYHNGEYIQLSGSGDLNGFSLRLDEGGRVVLDYVNPEDDTDTGTATLPSDGVGLEIVTQLREINASLYRLAGNTEVNNG